MKPVVADPTRASAAREAVDRTPRRLRIPGFLIDEEIGLGEVVKRASYALGIPTCAGCERRAAALDRWIVISR